MRPLAACVEWRLRAAHGVGRGFSRRRGALPAAALRCSRSMKFYPNRGRHAAILPRISSSTIIA